MVHSQWAKQLDWPFCLSGKNMEQQVETQWSHQQQRHLAPQPTSTVTNHSLPQGHHSHPLLCRCFRCFSSPMIKYKEGFQVCTPHFKTLVGLVLHLGLGCVQSSSFLLPQMIPRQRCQSHAWTHIFLKKELWPIQSDKAGYLFHSNSSLEGRESIF